MRIARWISPALAFAAGLVWALGAMAGPAAKPAPAAGHSFRDCPDCPLMVVTPPGRFVMGSPPTEKVRGTDEDQHPVTIGYALAIAREPVTRGEFARFVRETGRTVSGCSRMRLTTNDLGPLPDASWDNLPWQTDRHPVVCVSWQDAKAYTAWLSKRAGRPYRLLSEAEWEYAARAGTTSARYFGDDPAKQCRYANGADASGRARHPEWAGSADCNDGFPETAPVGHFPPNAFGLRDMLGNALQWVEDCYRGDYKGVPVDGAPMEICNAKGHRVARGGAWNVPPGWIKAAGRDVERPEARVECIGFRVARDL